MFRSVAALGVLCVFVLGCVSIAPVVTTSRPTAPGPVLATLPPLASPRPTAGASVVPTAAPTLEPTEPPTQPPTQTPTEIPQASVAPGPSPAGVQNYGASTPRINDGFDDPTSGWGVGSNAGGSVSYGESVLAIAAAGNGAWEYTTRQTGSTDNALQLETTFTPTGDGLIGLLCANSEDELWGATADAAGNYAFIKLDIGDATTLSHGQLDSLKTPPFAMARFGLDCAGTKTGSFKMQLFAPGTNEGVQYFAPVDEGPPSFDRVGIYAQSVTDPFSLSVDSLLAFGGTGDTAMSAAAVELMKHIPVDWQPKCFEGFASVFLTGATADVLCQLDGERSDYAEYTSFDNQADMDQSFQNMVTRWAVPETGVNCDTGAHQGGYSVGGQSAGNVLCAPAVTGVQFFWTDNSKLILSQLIDLEGSYADMYQDWLVAGPN